MQHLLHLSCPGVYCQAQTVRTRVGVELPLPQTESRDRHMRIWGTSPARTAPGAVTPDQEECATGPAASAAGARCRR